MLDLCARPQFVSWAHENGTKIPKIPGTPYSASVTDPSTWRPYSPDIDPLGFILTEDDPYFFIDIDHCLVNGQWSPIAIELCSVFNGIAAIEVSPSGDGLHIIGRAPGALPHKCKNIQLQIELYTTKRCATITGAGTTGSIGADCTEELNSVIGRYFKPAVKLGAPGESTLEDDRIIELALSSRSMRSLVGGGCNFRDLWERNVDVLAGAYPDSSGDRDFDYSSADAALVQHLAFWTGRDPEQMRRIMLKSGLVRDKWDRDDYIERTIQNAVSLCTDTYKPTAAPIDPGFPVPKLKGSPAQKDFAEKIRADILSGVDPTEETVAVLCATSGPCTSAKFWVDSKGKTLDDVLAAARRTSKTHDVYSVSCEPVRVEGYQYLTADLQVEHFKGCVYVQDFHKIFVPSGDLLNPDRFNAVYGGYTFQLDHSGDKTTKRAWEAYTESQVLRNPTVHGTVFDPRIAPGAIVERESRRLVNVYTPVSVRVCAGDVSPFTAHLEKVLPVKGDRDILLSYMAACVQHAGEKFQWAPLLQGTEGNGKTLFTRCVSYAVGRKYTHYPKAADVDNKFNGWLLNKLFIGIEDIYVSDSRLEVIETLKPMITGGDGLEIQLKGVDQITADICANFMLNSNHRDAIRKTENDRRFAVFYTAQQTAADLARDGMTGDYFPRLYEWLRGDGYAIVAGYLRAYSIPDELNPAAACHRAPETSSTSEVIESSRGGVEQEILEAIDEGRPGFVGGWVSSMALDRLLSDLRLNRAIPHNKRREILQSLGYDWHPGLRNGRVSRVVTVDNGKPKLFIKNGHLALNLATPAEISRAYEEAQTPTAADSLSAVRAIGV